MFPPCPTSFTRPMSRFLRHRLRLLALIVLCTLYILSSQSRFDAVRSAFISHSLPHAHSPPRPLLPFPVHMSAIAEWESALPQSEVSPTDAQGGERYLRFLNDNWGVGFNNQLQETSLCPSASALTSFLTTTTLHPHAQYRSCALSRLVYKGLMANVSE
jgi:hypothetical protein